MVAQVQDTRTVIPRQLSDHDAYRVARLFLQRVVGTGTRIEEGDTPYTYLVSSRSNPGTWHTVRVHPRMRTVSCTCPGFAYTGLCRHISAVIVRIHVEIVGGRTAMIRALRAHEAAGARCARCADTGVVGTYVCGACGREIEEFAHERGWPECCGQLMSIGWERGCLECEGHNELAG